MAKADKKASKADKTEKVEKVEKTAEFKYGVSDIAEELGINEASVRVKLRNAGVEKAGKSYGWNSKSDLKEVIDELKSDDKPAKKSKKDDADEKPAKGKKAKAEKAEKPKKGKKAKSDDEDDD